MRNPLDDIVDPNVRARLKRGLVEQYSNPEIVLRKAQKYLGKDVRLFISTKDGKKYMVEDPDGKMVHFGATGYEDYTKHGDEFRRNNYLARTANMKGNWRDNPYSPNNLARNLLW